MRDQGIKFNEQNIGSIGMAAKRINLLPRFNYIDILREHKHRLAEYRLPPITKLSWRVSREVIIIPPRTANGLAFEFPLQAAICNTDK